VAVITNIFNEHLSSADPRNPNYHKSKADYLKAKKNIVQYQSAKDLAVLNFSNPTVREMIPLIKSQIYYFSSLERVGRGTFIDEQQIKIKVLSGEFIITKVNEIALFGQHNLENICAASLAGFLIGVPLEKITQAVKSFPGLSHRLEFVKEINDIKYYNDSAATIPQATILSLNAFSEPKIIILGGADKSSDFNLLIERLKPLDIRGIILLPGTASVRLASLLTKQKLNFQETENMTAAVSLAHKVAQRGEVVLLSPACASFGIFKNYQERGEQFKEAVKSLKG
jgi:UDP-N-acetylmuramoylalanine--D-glutamate ligase